MKSLTRNLGVALGILCTATTSVLAGDWPAFRGPLGNGVAPNDRAPLHWGPQSNILWKVDLPGPGNSSPIVSNERVFITCAEDEGRKRNLYCFDRRTGKMLWVRTAEVATVEATHRTNPYCASTPAADGERVIVWHGSAGLFCYNFAGEQLWKAALGEIKHDWGYASSPILYHDKVLLNFGPGARTFLVALDLETGRVLWQQDEPGGLDATDKRMVGSWSTPIIINAENQDQILCSMPTRVIACAPETGALIWWCTGLGDKVDLVYASPLVCGDIAVAFTGWVNGPTIGFKLGGAGDVTASQRLWLDKQTQRIGSGVAVGEHVYIVNAGPGTAQCIEAKTGKTLWTERLEGGESWGSLILAANHFYVTSRRGITSVFRADPSKLEPVAMNDLGEPSHATPAISDGQIFLRTDKRLYCIGESTANAANSSNGGIFAPRRNHEFRSDRPKVVSKEIFRRFDGRRPPAAGFVAYVSKTEPILMHCHGWEDYSDGYDDYSVRLSSDNGKTWAAEEVRWKSSVVPEGRLRYAEPAAFFDPDTEKLIVLIDRELYPKDQLNVDADYGLAIDIYDAKTKTWSERRELNFPQQRTPAMSFSFPIKTTGGRLLFPGMRKTLDAAGKALHYKNGWATVDEVVTVIGEYSDGGEIAWRLGQPLNIAPESSSRGLNENALFQLPSGRIAAVCRGDNSAFPEKPGHKWLSFSDDDGTSWSGPLPLPATGGEPLESGSNGSALFRSIKNGRLYWLGNLALRGERANGNWPRSPLVIVEVQEEPFALKRETIFAVDERGLNDSPQVQMSNFRFYQDRETGEVVIFLTRYGEKSEKEWMVADYYRYRVELP